LHATRERLELALRGADLGLWDWNVPTGRVVYDERWVQMLGYAPGELAPTYHTWETRVHPEDLPRVLHALQEHLEGRTPFYEVEHRLRTKTGEWKWILARGQVVLRDRYQGPIRCAGTHLDLSARKRAEEMMRMHQEQLLHASRISLVGEMAAGLAHHMAQPVSAMLYYARGCAAHLEAGTWGIAEARQTLQKIATQAKRGGEFIHRLKAFVRREEPQRLPVDINTLIHDVLDLSSAEAQASHVIVQLELTAGLPAVVVDRVQIEQVLLNLLRNGIDAMDRTPFDARQLVIRTCTDPDERVSVTVEDTGPGVPSGLEQQIFDAFFSTKPAGTGLGLSISRSIIEAHEGRLWLSRAPGRGAIFGFTLPAEAGDEHGRQPADGLPGG
jgi:PAS domain S-box-containing protein